MEEDKREVCEELDKTVLEAMSYLKQLSLLRTTYGDAVREVGIIWSGIMRSLMFLYIYNARATLQCPRPDMLWEGLAV